MFVSTKTKRERLHQYLDENPLVEERFMAIIDLSKNADGNCITLDETEERLIAEMQQLGNGVLTVWAVDRATKTSDELHSVKRTIKHSKKNCIS